MEAVDLMAPLLTGVEVKIARVLASISVTTGAEPIKSTCACPVGVVEFGCTGQDDSLRQSFLTEFADAGESLSGVSDFRLLVTVILNQLQTAGQIVAGVLSGSVSLLTIERLVIANKMRAPCRMLCAAAGFSPGH